MSRLDRGALRKRADLAHEMLGNCNLCTLRCGVNRLAGELGYCRLDDRAFWFRENLNYFQEMDLIPSHSIYLTGCSMRCEFCSVENQILNPIQGRLWEVESLQRIVEERKRQGAKTLVFVGGEATVNLPAILDLLAELPDRYVVVWDSNMYLSEESRILLDGVVDIYAADLKFGDNACARRVAGAARYLDTLSDNLAFAERTASLIVRHLILPGHFDCCMVPLLDWLVRHVRNPRLSLRREYLPPIKEFKNRGLDAYVTEDEFELARRGAMERGVELVF